MTATLKQVHTALPPAIRKKTYQSSVKWLATIVLLCSGLVPRSIHASELNFNFSELKREVVSNYAAVVCATSQDSLAAAKHLQHAVDAFLAMPSEKSLRAAREAWLAARVPYDQMEVCRFYDGPIDQVDGMLNAWPIDENYIDYTAGNHEAGLINAISKFPILSKELILSLNEKEGKKNISTGFHAIEFLLWGQDFSATGPGNRPWQDYVNGTKNADRRRTSLRIVTSLLVEHLETVAAAWTQGKVHNYRSEFTTADPDVALGNILKGMGILSGREVAGERLTVPYETKAQEDEQSCFSDNTHNDFINDALGIQNIYLGRYVDLKGQRTTGPGLNELLDRADAAFQSRLAAQIEGAVAAARGIPKPFDQAILGNDTAPGRVAIKKAINAFQAESDAIAEAAKLLSLKINL
jgi:putative iron-regulated protein